MTGAVLTYKKSMTGEIDHHFKIDGDVATVGITDFAQHQLTDIVYIYYG